MTSRRAFDVSLVMNTHAGSVFLTRTLRSFEEAAFMAREAGLRLELVFIMNDSPPSHLALARRYACALYDDIVVVEVSRASLGAARQDGLGVARGEYVCFADDDDLVSFNSIVECHRQASQAGPRAIVVPQYLVTFGHHNYVAEYSGSDVVSPLAWIKYHPFISRIFFHASAVEHLGYADVVADGGYAYEDWHFNAGAIAHGYRFVSAPGTILFYRQRPAGLLAQFNAGAIRQIPPSPLFHPDTYLRICREAAVAFDGGFPQVDFDAVRHAFTEDPACRVATFAANQIDPTVDWEKIRGGTAWVNWFGDLRPGAAYHAACRILRGLAFDHVILCQDPSDPTDARRVSVLVDVVRAARPDARFLLLAADGTGPAGTGPADATTIHLGSLYPGLADSDIDAIALRIIENAGVAARLHLVGGAFPRRFYLTYRRVLGRARAIYYRDADRVRSGDGLPAVEAPDIAFLSEVLSNLDLVVAGSVHGMMRDRAMIGIHEDRWTYLYALPRDKAATPHPGDASGGCRLLWIANRSDPEQAALVDAVEDALLADGGAVQLTISAEADLVGLVEGGEPAAHDGVIHTARVENLPAVLLDALAAGVPVIGLAVGGVGEAVVDGETGWLIEPGPVDGIVPILVEAIRQCYRGSEAHARRSSGATLRAYEMRRSGGVGPFLASTIDPPVD